MNVRTLVGTCGFAASQAQTFPDFGVVEIQQTFYQPPRLATLARWRREAPEGFVFTLEASQLLAAEPTSPTYRRLREVLSHGQLARAGGFRWNPVTREAWERTREAAAALRAEAILFQTPSSFLPTRDRLRRLFETVDRDGRWLVLEARGEAWTDEILSRVLAGLSLVHGVDPFLRAPSGGGVR
jgi:uncharacterized protein YecE (DUF72 family)